MEIVKTIHVSCALLSILGFISRGVLMMFDSAIMKTRWIRIAPHFIDTALLVSAIVLAVQYSFSPFNSPWLAAKIIALVVYVGLGTVALRAGSTKIIRVVAWVAALMTFIYIAAVAVTKSPFVFV